MFHDLVGLIRIVMAFVMISVLTIAKDHPTRCNFGDAELEGVVVLRTKYGAPGFAKDGISPKVRVKMLKLDCSISVTPPSETPPGFEPVGSIQLIQMVELADVELQNLVGRRVKAKGQLEGAMTGHHYTSAILVIAKNEDVKPVARVKRMKR